MRAQRRGRAGFCCAVAVLGLLAAPARGDEAPTHVVPGAPEIEVEPDTAAEPIAWEAWEDLGAKAFDAVVLRPLGAGTVAGGFGAFLLVLPLAWYSQGFDTVWDQFVLQPVDYTFQRPLGDF
jgi:hypothetical protein